MRKWYDNFEEMYDFFDTLEADFMVNGYRYLTHQYGDDEHPRLLHLEVYDYDSIPKGCFLFDEKYLVEERDFENSVELINDYTLANGKTMAQMTCDEMGKPYSILPVYPKWYSPLCGDMDPPKDTMSDEEWEHRMKEIHEIEKEDVEKIKKEYLLQGKFDKLAEMERRAKLSPDERQKELAEEMRKIFVKE